MKLVLFGPPGSGKGTQSQLLVDGLGFVHISTGDLFREAIKNQTALGQEAQAFMDRGELVPDAIVIGMVRDRLGKFRDQNVIFDGFPRTVPQAKSFDEMLNELDQSLDVAVFLEVPESSLIHRLSGRRQTQDGRHVYHLEFNPPKVDGVCDVTGAPLIQRSDDREEVISARLEAYKKGTEPLKDFYRQKNCLVEIMGDESALEVSAQIKAALQLYGLKKKIDTE